MYYKVILFFFKVKFFFLMIVVIDIKLIIKIIEVFVEL